MTTTTRTAAPAPTRTTRRRTALTLLAGILIAAVACTVVAYAALAAGADPAFAPLRPAIYVPFVAAGVLAAYVGWRAVRRRAARPARTLGILVPLLTAVSFVPDVILAVTGFIPGTSLTGVMALGIMHIVVVGVAVPICLRLAPLSATDRVDHHSV